MDLTCALWSCVEAAHHSQAHDDLAEQEGNVGVVIIGGMYDRQTNEVASKCRLSRALERACGVPLLPSAALETNPWLQSDTFFNRELEAGEAQRNWIFFGPILDLSPAFRHIWRFYDSRRVIGFDMSRISYYLDRDQRSNDGMFKLCKYVVPGIQPEAFYVLLFKPSIPGENGGFIDLGKKKRKIMEKEPKRLSPSKDKESEIPSTQTGTVSAFGGPLVGGSIQNKEEELTRTKDVKGGEEDKVLQEEMTTPPARARVLVQQDDLCKLTRALGVLASAFVHGMIQNLEKEIDDEVDIKIGKGWLLLDMDGDGKITPDEVVAAAMYLKDTLASEGLQQLISSLSKDKWMVEPLPVKVNAWEDESRNEFLRLVKKEVEFYNKMVVREDVGGEKAAMKAYKAASDQSDEVAEADEVSSELMEMHLEKEIDDDVDIKIGKGWLLPDRDRDGKVTPEEVAAAAMCT